ncbi:MAG: hypothetical protein QOF40_2262 [Actinomycetota bacterium]|nr:hypothetical protein [Actinomycetota bacterium]
MSMDATATITLLCDNTDSPNWGCRATSLALHDCLHRPDRRVRAFPRGLGVRTIARLPGRGVPKSVARLANRVAGRMNAVSGPRTRTLARHLDAIDTDFDASADRVVRAARSNRRWGELVDAIRDSSMVVINGEGSMIFTSPPRRDLLFQMTMARVAQRAGVPVHYVNAMVSPCPATGQHDDTVRACVPVLADCASVVLRDPVSAEYLLSLGGSRTNASCAPDALFSWASWDDATAAPATFGVLDSFPERAVAFAGRPALPGSYVALSGASVPPGVAREGWVQRFTDLAHAIEKTTGLPVVLVAPDAGDEFLRGVGEALGTPVVGPTAPLVAGCGLLASASAYVSGRYHPSIMATLGGTPLVNFGANSHKLHGLAHLLGEPLPTLPTVDDRDFVEAVVTQLTKALTTGDARVARRAQALELGRDARAAYAGIGDPA